LPSVNIQFSNYEFSLIRDWNDETFYWVKAGVSYLFESKLRLEKRNTVWATDWVFSQIKKDSLQLPKTVSNKARNLLLYPSPYRKIYGTRKKRRLFLFLNSIKKRLKIICEFSVLPLIKKQKVIYF
jgi:hypothetical protein